MAKINLSDIQSRLIKRGRQHFTDEALEAEIAELDPAVEGDGFIYEVATGEIDSEDFPSHKNLWRGRVARCAETVGVTCSVQWTDLGEMVVTLQTAKKKRNRK